MKNVVTIIAIVGTAMLVYAIVTPGFIDSIGAMLGEPSEYCTENPTKWDCTCPPGQIKGGGFNKYECFTENLPETYSIPITSFGEAVVFAKEKANNARCDGDMIGNWAGMSPDAPIGSYATIECTKMVSATSGTGIWRIDFNPTDGFLWRIECNPNYIENCPTPYIFEPVIPEPIPITGYFCNKAEFNEWLQEIVQFTPNADGTITYPDNFNYATQISITEMKAKAKEACENTSGESAFPYTNNTEFKWTERYGVYGAFDFARGFCVVERNDGATLGTWGFWLQEGKWVTPDGSYRKDSPGLGQITWRNGFGFSETGICYKKA